MPARQDRHERGLYGWGEAVAFPGVRESILEGFAPRLIGRDPLEVQRTWRNPWLAPYENGYAVGAVDVALHDLWGKALGVPVHQLYGGAWRKRVPGYASAGLYLEGIDPKDHWLEEALGLVERGFLAIKMRMGRYDPEYELPLVREVRKAVPADVKLMVDAWGSYTLPTALRVGRELQDMGFYWYEEPLRQDGYRAYEVLAAELDIAVAGGETLQTRGAFKEIFDRRAVDIVQPDVSICGGISDLLFVADLATLYGIQCLPHSFNSGVTAAASLQVAALLPGADADARCRRAADGIRHDREQVHGGSPDRAARVQGRTLRAADETGSRDRDQRGFRSPLPGLRRGSRAGLDRNVRTGAR